MKVRDTVSSILKISTRSIQVVSIMTQLHYTCLTCLRYPLRRRLGGPGRYGHFREEKKFLLGIEPHFLCCLAFRLGTIPTMPGLVNWQHACQKWHAACTVVPIFFISFITQHPYIVKNMCMYTHIWLQGDCIWSTAATKQHCKLNICTQIKRGAKGWPDIYHSGTILVVTGQICDTGQTVLNPRNKSLTQVAKWDLDELPLPSTTAAAFLQWQMNG